MNFERILGRALTRDERGSVPTLNDITPNVLRDATLIAETSVVAAAIYLHEVVVHAALGDATDFINEVIRGGAPATTWGFADRLCIPRFESRELLTLGVDPILNPLRGLDGDRWSMLEPTIENWDPAGFGGAPGVLVRRTPYWFWGPQHSDYLAVTDTETLNVPDVHVGLRRWIASRIAWELRLRPAEARSTPSAIRDAVGVRESDLSRDGAIALAALVRETTLQNVTESPPGFRGPDEWYAGARGPTSPVEW